MYVHLGCTKRILVLLFKEAFSFELEIFVILQREILLIGHLAAGTKILRKVEVLEMMNCPSFHTESKCKRIQYKINQTVLVSAVITESDIFFLAYVILFLSNSVIRFDSCVADAKFFILVLSK
jgi:hypothetical protein